MNSLELDEAGNVFIGGFAPTGLPTTAGTVQPSVPNLRGFVMKLNHSGTAVTWSTYWGDRVKALHMDSTATC